MKDIVTAVDILNEQTQLEQDAKETLPGKFETCTFNQGYVRQSLFACETCSTTKDAGRDKKDDISRTTSDNDNDNKVFEPAGMCYSCSIACHADHVLYELFPKRHFRCDCGVKDKFGKHPCQLSAGEKGDTSNEENRYNHNFEGRYCRCNQIYNPSEEEETMYQCVLCEDWFHERCIGDIPAEVREFESYMCRKCVNGHDYIAIQDPKFNYGVCQSEQPIHRWVGPSIQSTLQPDQTENIDIESSGTCDDTLTNTTNNDSANRKRKHDDATEGVETNIKKPKLIDGDDGCKRVHGLLKDDEWMELFLSEGWREKLCRCKECGPRYKADNIEFILEEETTHEPEEDEDAGKSLLQIGMEQLGKMNRVEALDGLRMYQTLWDQIKPFLQTFQESGKVVTEGDIQAFFEQRRQEREEEKNRSR